MDPGVECVADVAALQREIAALKLQRAGDTQCESDRRHPVRVGPATPSASRTGDTQCANHDLVNESGRVD